MIAPVDHIRAYLEKEVEEAERKIAAARTILRDCTPRLEQAERLLRMIDDQVWGGL